MRPWALSVSAVRAAAASVWLCCGMLLQTSCDAESAPSTGVPQEGNRSTEVETGAEPPLAPAGRRVSIELGKFRAGAVPGKWGRVPELEPTSTEIQLGAFQIDARPFPNDPQKPPRVVESQDKAGLLCAEKGGRLCTELEWERGCKGPDGRPFSTGDEWRCEDPRRCRTPEGIFALGSVKEWTGSQFGEGSEYHKKPVLRGAALEAGAGSHRCSRRFAGEGPAAFRCCYGAPNGARVSEPEQEFVYRKTELETERLRELLAAHPRTRDVAVDLLFFREPDAARTVVDRGPGDRKGFKFTVAPLLWNPVPGARFLAVSARSGENTSFIVVFHVLGDDDYSIASSFIMRDEVGPVAFAYSPGIEPRFHFSNCWGCPGETGKILYRDHDRAVVLQP